MGWGGGLVHFHPLAEHAELCALQQADPQRAFLEMGIICNGVGTSMMVTAVNEQQPRKQVPNPGWNMYETSWGCYGIALLAAGVYAVSGDNSESRDINVGAAIVGGIFFGLGTYAHFATWSLFSKSADAAQEVHNGLKLGLAPLLVPDSQGDAALGLRLSLAL